MGWYVNFSSPVLFAVKNVYYGVSKGIYIKLSLCVYVSICICDVGVEWETKGRGSNDGSLENKVYFTCEQGQGSFVHPKKVKLTSNIVEAITKRYKQDDSKGMSSHISFKLHLSSVHSAP